MWSRLKSAFTLTYKRSGSKASLSSAASSDADANDKPAAENKQDHPPRSPRPASSSRKQSSTSTTVSVRTRPRSQPTPLSFTEARRRSRTKITSPLSMTSSDPPDAFQQLASMDSDLQDLDIVSYLHLKALLEGQLGRSVQIRTDDMRRFRGAVQSLGTLYADFRSILSESVKFKMAAVHPPPTPRSMTTPSVRSEPSEATIQSSLLLLTDPEPRRPVVERLMPLSPVDSMSSSNTNDQVNSTDDHAAGRSTTSSGDHIDADSRQDSTSDCNDPDNRQDSTTMNMNDGIVVEPATPMEVTERSESSTTDETSVAHDLERSQSLPVSSIASTASPGHTPSPSMVVAAPPPELTAFLERALVCYHAILDSIDQLTKLLGVYKRPAINPQTLINARTDVGHIQSFLVRPKYRELVKGCGSAARSQVRWAGMDQPGDAWMNGK